MSQPESLEIEEIETEIDAAFATNSLKSCGYAQAIWTLLSQNEDMYMRAIHELRADELDVFTDLRLNSLTYPLRVCHFELAASSGRVDARLIDEDYKAAWRWLEVSCHAYYSFCAIFPLWRRGIVEIKKIDAGKLSASYVVSRDRAYEVYNRLVAKEARSESKEPIPTEAIAREVMSNTTRGNSRFKVNFNPRLVSQLVSGIDPMMKSRYLLPSDWRFDGFTLAQFQRVYTTLQAMLWGWLIGRNIVAADGMPGMAYSSSVWTVAHEELRARLQRYTAIDGAIIDRLLSLLTFGSHGIRNPDVAIQPLLDLGGKNYALSPFVWLNSHAERNLCVLLNQIPEQREIYEKLKNGKEAMLRTEIRDFCASIGLDVRGGEVDGTDLDIAIIDRAARAALFVELKWFIEPAEVREGFERTKELKRGIDQVKKVLELYRRQDSRLLHDVLQIDADFVIGAVVASVNWIGHADAQDPEVPIVKVWHLLEEVRRCGSVLKVVDWLAERRYLPVEGTHFFIEPVELVCGGWSCDWYLIKTIDPV